jgi:hypothetical protein
MTSQPVHTNDPSVLPPVDCPLLIALRQGDVMVRAERVSHLRNRDGEMDYRLEDGIIVTGRYRWVYP